MLCTGRTDFSLALCSIVYQLSVLVVSLFRLQYRVQYLAAVLCTTPTDCGRLCVQCTVLKACTDECIVGTKINTAA